MIKIFYSEKLKEHGSYQLLHKVLTEYCGLPQSFRLMRTRKGKPYLDDYPEISFSITHTDDIWICAVTDAQIGIDAEMSGRILSKPEKIMKRYFSEAENRYIRNGIHVSEEYSYIQDENTSEINADEILGISSDSIEKNLSEDQQSKAFNERFLKVWTRKEAYLKLKASGVFSEIKDICCFEQSDADYIVLIGSDGLILSLCMWKKDCICDKKIVKINLDNDSIEDYVREKF